MSSNAVLALSAEALAAVRGAEAHSASRILDAASPKAKRYLRERAREYLPWETVADTGRVEPFIDGTGRVRRNDSWQSIAAGQGLYDLEPLEIPVPRIEAKLARFSPRIQRELRDNWWTTQALRDSLAAILAAEYRRAFPTPLSADHLELLVRLWDKTEIGRDGIVVQLARQPLDEISNEEFAKLYGLVRRILDEKIGRPRLYATNAQRQKAYRKRKHKVVS